jgi:hypothetical protein
MNAGCLFTNGTHVLAGYQKSSINGIGGKAEEGEEPAEPPGRDDRREGLVGRREGLVDEDED